MYKRYALPGPSRPAGHDAITDCPSSDARAQANTEPDFAVHRLLGKPTGSAATLTGLRLRDGDDLKGVDAGFCAVRPCFCETAVYNIPHAAEGY